MQDKRHEPQASIHAHNSSRRRLRYTRVAVIGLFLFSLITTLPVSPASAQAGSRLCGYHNVYDRFIQVHQGNRLVWKEQRLSRAYVIEIPKGSTAVQKDICTAAQRRIKDAKVLPNRGITTSIRRTECEDVASMVDYSGDPCDKMSRATTVVEAYNRSVAVISNTRSTIRFHSPKQSCCR